MKKYRNNHSGFTLAEVLIVLLVIGVVAGITIPVLIKDTQDAELKTAWKRTFSDLSQSTKRIITDNGGTLKGLCADNDSDCFRNAYLPYISYIRSCSSSDFTGNCWHKKGITKLLSGTLKDRYAGPGVVLNSGQFIRFLFYSSACNLQTGNIFYCGGILTDVNGSKGPNTVGKDIFEVAVTENGLKPDGTQGDGSEDDCVTNPPAGSGWGCSARYLYQ